jgi:hypothetical protein
MILFDFTAACVNRTARYRALFQAIWPGFLPNLPTEGNSDDLAGIAWLLEISRTSTNSHLSLC